MPVVQISSEWPVSLKLILPHRMRPVNQDLKNRIKQMVNTCLVRRPADLLVPIQSVEESHVEKRDKEQKLHAPEPTQLAKSGKRPGRRESTRRKLWNRSFAKSIPNLSATNTTDPPFTRLPTHLGDAQILCCTGHGARTGDCPQGACGARAEARDAADGLFSTIRLFESLVLET